MNHCVELFGQTSIEVVTCPFCFRAIDYTVDLGEQLGDRGFLSSGDRVDSKTTLGRETSSDNIPHIDATSQRNSAHPCYTTSKKESLGSLVMLLVSDRHSLPVRSDSRGKHQANLLPLRLL